MKKLIFLGLGMIMAAATCGVIVHHAQAAFLGVATDINGRILVDGDLISASANGDPDIYIVKPYPNGDFAGYKRLFLNPAIFSFYGHLGGFANVHVVSPQTRDLFPTSGLFRNCESGAPQVWATEITGEDTGIFHHVAMSGEAAASEDSRFFQKIFCINTREENFYAKSIYPYSHLAEIPNYERRACLPLPPCAYSNPITCAVKAAPGFVYCPAPSPTPTYSPSAVYINQVLIPQPPQTQSHNTITISGTMPNPCYTLNPVTVVRNADIITITVAASSTLGPMDGACVGVIQPFTTSAALDMTFAPAGNYIVVVNGLAYGSFYHLPGASPSPYPYPTVLPVSITRTEMRLTQNTGTSSDGWSVLIDGSLSASCYVLAPVQVAANNTTSNRRIDVTVQASSSPTLQPCSANPVPFSTSAYLSGVMSSGYTYNVYVNGMFAGTAQ